MFFFFLTVAGNIWNFIPFVNLISLLYRSKIVFGYLDKLK